MNLEVEPIFFETPEEFRVWLEKNHKKANELIVGYYKVGSGKKSMNWSQSVDQALCFGWIDGIRKSIDNESYFIRFTPRRPDSNWSTVNIKKVDQLTKQGLMRPAGLAAFMLREESKSGIYTYENKEMELPDEFERQFKVNVEAWNYFQSMPLYYRKTSIRWVMDAKQELTRKRRLAELISDSEAGQKIKPLRY
jgi:uncharacterized protein YdeI (YjbR/CyaY-like superfamily)